MCRDASGDVVMAEAQAGGLSVAVTATGSVPAAAPSALHTQVRQVCTTVGILQLGRSTFAHTVLHTCTDA